MIYKTHTLGLTDQYLRKKILRKLNELKFLPDLKRFWKHSVHGTASLRSVIATKLH